MKEAPMRAMSDRSTENGNGSGFAVGLLCGAAIGATVALLFAPKSGIAFRREVASASGRLKKRAQQFYEGAADTVDDLSSRGADAMDTLSKRGSKVVSDLSRRGSQVLDDLSKRGAEAMDDLADRGAEAIDEGRDAVDRMGARARSHARGERSDSM
jgi:gas vesicle protein